jgi:hypothetical protein
LFPDFFAFTFFHCVETAESAQSHGHQAADYYSGAAMPVVFSGGCFLDSSKFMAEAKDLVGVQDDSGKHDSGTSFLFCDKVVYGMGGYGVNKGHEFFITVNRLSDFVFDDSGNGKHDALSFPAYSQIVREVFFPVGALATWFSAGVDHLYDTAGNK